MNIFEKRPLSLILCIMLGGFSLFIDSTLSIKFSLIGVSLIFILLVFLIKGIDKSSRILCCTSALGLIVSILLGIIFANLHYPSNYYNRACEINAVVTSTDHTQSYASKLNMTIHEIDGTRVNFKVVATVDKEIASGIISGHNVKFVGELEPFGTTASGFNEKSYYSSRGYSARVTDIEAITIVAHLDDYVHDPFAKWRGFLSDELKKATNAETGGFLAALILGDTESLDGNTKLNFTSAGISHLLALSGMHLVILSEAIKKLLGLFRLNKKFIVTASTAFAILYMLLTGCPQSVVRATVMLVITNALFLLKNTHDSYTTLPLSVIIILIVQPYAVYDLALWLSAFATLGILAFTDYRGKDEVERPLLVRALIWIWDAILSTIFSIGACYAIMAVNFKTFSVVAPITTLIFSVPVNMLIYVGIILLLLPSSIPLGQPVIWFTDAIKEGVEIFTSERWMPLSLDFPIVTAVIAVFCISFFSLLIFNLKHKRIMAAASIFLFMLSVVLGAIFTQSIRAKERRVFDTREYSDNLLISSNNTIAMVYNGSHSVSSAWDDIEALGDEKVLFLDKLILTSYTDNTTLYISNIISSVKTDRLYLPAPHGIYEMEQAEIIAEILSLYGTDLKFYDTEEAVQIGDVCYRLLMRETYLPGEITSQIYSVEAEGKIHTYISDGAAEEFGALAYRIYDISYSLTFGAWGEGGSYSYEFSYVGNSLKEIYIAGDTSLSDEAREFYEKNEVPITKIGTS